MDYNLQKQAKNYIKILCGLHSYQNTTISLLIKINDASSKSPSITCFADVFSEQFAWNAFQKYWKNRIAGKTGEDLKNKYMS